MQSAVDPSIELYIKFCANCYTQTAPKTFLQLRCDLARDMQYGPVSLSVLV